MLIPKSAENIAIYDWQGDLIQRYGQCLSQPFWIQQKHQQMHLAGSTPKEVSLSLVGNFPLKALHAKKDI
uniref:Putative ovule protein n=1 Tax=Solanum chacoense TaxID=4108 RepID=A0A0V0GNL0_SOLCH